MTALRPDLAPGSEPVVARNGAPIGSPPPPRKPKPKAAPLPPWRLTASIAGVSLALLAVWCLLFVVVFSGLSHARRQHQLYANFRKDVAQAQAPIGGVIPSGTAVAVLSIPRAGLQNEVVVEGTTSTVMRDGPGHLSSTPLPGQPGVSVVYGKSLSYGAPFGSLDRLHAGDPITTTTDQGVFHYVVLDVRRAGDVIPPIPAGPFGRLTLITSGGGLTPSSAVYVDAELRGKPAVDPGGRPATVGPDDGLMATDANSLVLAELVFWLQLLLVVAALIAWLQARWHRRQVWVIGAAALLAVIWSASNCATSLLPNVL